MKAALIGGLIGGGLFAFFGARSLASNLQRRVSNAISGQGVALTTLQRDAQALKAEMESYARRVVQEAARQAAEQVVSREYGLTQTRIRMIESVGRRLGL